MFEPAYRRRARPSARALAYATVVFLAALYVTLFLGVFGAYVYVPLVVGAAVALGITVYRRAGMRSALPKPYGKGKVTRIDTRRSTRDAILLMSIGVLIMLVLFGSVFLFSPAVFLFPAMFGLMVGLPLSQLLYYAFVFRLEATLGSKIYLITEEVTENEQAVLLKSVELKALDKDGRASSGHATQSRASANA